MSAFGYSVIVFTTFLGGTAGIFASCCTCFFVVGGDAYGGGSVFRTRSLSSSCRLLCSVVANWAAGLEFG